MLSAPRRAFALNRFGLWFDKSLTCLEKQAGEFGKNYTLVNLFTKSNYLRTSGLIKRLSEKLDSTTATPSTERLSITDNSKLLFYSPSVGKYIPKMRAWELVLAPYVLLFPPTWIPAIVYGLFSFFHQPLLVSASRMFVVRMDLLPHMECILFQKVGIFGLPRTELVPIKNLVKMKAQHSYYDYYFRLMGGVDYNMMFRDVETKEEYAFDLNGVWVEENLKHELIN